MMEFQHRYEDRITSRIFATYTNLYFVGYDVRILKKQQEQRTETGKRF